MWLKPLKLQLGFRSQLLVDDYAAVMSSVHVWDQSLEKILNITIITGTRRCNTFASRYCKA